MKDLIVLTASIMLGIVLFTLLAGPQDSSLRSGLSRLWENEMTVRTTQEF